MTKNDAREKYFSRGKFSIEDQVGLDADRVWIDEFTDVTEKQIKSILENNKK